MISLVSVASLLLVLPLVSAAPRPLHQRADDACTVKTQRKPWQLLTSTEKSDYINATICLLNAPPKTDTPSVKTRWDELQRTHAYQMPYIHGTGAFLPFHRYFVTVHEKILRDECDYQGPTPYWDEASDAQDMLSSVIFDPETGFGGNGTGKAHCVVDGPFANLTLHVQKDLSDSDYCLTRNFDPCSFRAAAQSNVDTCMAKETFEEARQCLEGSPHGAGHGGVGGTMLDVQLSPGDPIFWLHHAYLDKLWWDWQSKDLEARIAVISGPNTQTFRGFNQTGRPPFSPPGGDNSSFPFDPACSRGPPSLPPGGFNGTFGMPMKPDAAIIDYFGDGGNVTTMNHVLFSSGILPNVTIGDVMDIRSGFVCAEYL